MTFDEALLDTLRAIMAGEPIPTDTYMAMKQFEIDIDGLEAALRAIVL